MPDDKEKALLPEVITKREKRPQGRPRVEFNAETVQIIYRMAKQGLPLAVIAGSLGCGKRTLERRMKENPEVFDAISLGRSEAYKEIHDIAFDLAKNEKNERFIQYFLELHRHHAEESHQQAVDEANDVNNDASVNKARLQEALKKDRFLEVGESDDVVSEKATVADSGKQST